MMRAISSGIPPGFTSLATTSSFVDTCICTSLLTSLEVVTTSTRTKSALIVTLPSNIPVKRIQTIKALRLYCLRFKFSPYIFLPVLHTFLPACLLTLPTYLSIPLPTYLPVSLPTPTFLLPACTYQPTCTYQPYLPIFLPPFLIAHLSANLLSYPIYLSASACLPSYLYHLLTSSPKKCPLRCVPRTLKTRVKKKMSKMFPFILYLLSREVTK